MDFRCQAFHSTGCQAIDLIKSPSPRASGEKTRIGTEPVAFLLGNIMAAINNGLMLMNNFFQK